VREPGKESSEEGEESRGDMERKRSPGDVTERRGGENEPVEEQESGRQRGKRSKRQETEMVYFVC